MKKILKPAGVFIKAMPHFLVFELIFKLLLLAVGTPVTALLLKLTMKLSGVTYLNDESSRIQILISFIMLTIKVISKKRLKIMPW